MSSRLLALKFKLRKLEVNKEPLKFEDVLRNDHKNTQRSCNLVSSLFKNSSETQTHRRSSVTRAESDTIDSFRPKSRRLKNSLQNLKIYQKSHSSKEIPMPEKIEKPEGRNIHLRRN